MFESVRTASRDLLWAAFMPSEASLESEPMSGTTATRLLIWKIYLLVVGAFVLFGNAPRILPISGTFGSINAGEIVLFMAGLSIFLFAVGTLLVCRVCVALIAATFLSLLVGLVKWGIDEVAIAYNLRFALEVFSGWMAGIALVTVYRNNAKKVMALYVNLYASVSLIGIVLLFIFPNSAELWAQLSDVGVVFSGDSHEGRLVSFYGDPNLFGMIIVLPIFIAYYLSFRLRKAGTLLFVFIMSIALLFTVSRSGLSLFFIMCGCLLLSRGAKLLYSKNENRSFMSSILILGGLLAILLPIVGSYADIAFERFRFTFDDDLSAYARWESFQTGLDLLAQEPVLGYGYNFSLYSLQHLGRGGFDSSLESFAVNYGLLICLLMVIFLIHWWFRISNRLKRNGANHDLRSLWNLLILYIVLTLGSAGNFNQILFFSFWIVPIVALIAYVEFASYLRSDIGVRPQRRGKK